MVPTFLLLVHNFNDVHVLFDFCQNKFNIIFHVGLHVDSTRYVFENEMVDVLFVSTNSKQHSIGALSIWMP